MDKKLKDLLKNSFPDNIYDPSKPTIRLQEVNYDTQEVEEALKSLLSTYVVMGEKTKLFEQLWSKWIGRNYSVFVNSGSSGLLLAMMWIKFKKSTSIKNEILIPAVTWSTSIFPAIIVGLKPVLVDVDLSNLCTNSFAEHISDNTVAILPVHLMGHACNMEVIMEEAKKHNLVVIEDCCEAHGAKYNRKKVGTFGDVGVWSSMFAHHISTIEGGLISSDRVELDDLFRMFRAHGWVRDISDKKKKEIINNNINIDPSFLFPELGLNVRPTEINAAFGIHQVQKIDGFIEKRRTAFQNIHGQLKDFEKYFTFFPEQKNEYFSPFAFPILLKNNAPFSRKEIINHLTENRIEHRPIAGSNMAQQPFMKNYGQLLDISDNLPNAKKIHENGFFIGVNHQTNESRIEYIVKSFKSFLKKY